MPATDVKPSFFVSLQRERINEKKRDLSDKLELLGANQRNEKMEKAKVSVSVGNIIG